MAGPADRVAFQTEQTRRRRRTWRLSAVCALAAVLTGIPVSLVFTPAVLTLLLLATKVAQLTIGVPDNIWDRYEQTLFPLIDVINRYTDESPASPPLTSVLHAGLVWILPGMISMLLIWPALRALFLRGGAGGALLALGARPPRPGDLEERQLVNVVEEMAIAAGLPPPKVMLLDSPVANAAAIGSSPRDATVLVSRGLLDDLDRDETQGILASLIASIGNGDLRIALSIMAVYQTYGFTYALLNAPFSPHARRTLLRIARWIFIFWGRRDHAVEAEIVSGMLTRGLWTSEEQDDFARAIDAPPDAPRPGLISFWGLAPVLFIGLTLAAVFTNTPIPFEVIVGAPIGLLILLALADLRYVIYAGGRAVTIALICISLPYYIGAFMSQFLLWLLSSVALGPLLALVWRTRRYLADATAVQLTRNPSAVAGGLLALQRSGGLIPGGRWAAPLFVVGNEAAMARQASLAAARAADDRKAGASALRGLWTGDPAATQQFAERMTEREALEGSGGFSGEPGSMVSLNPSIQRRLARLRAMGADVEQTGSTDRAQPVPSSPDGRAPRAIGVVGIVLLALLTPLAAVLMVVAMALMAVFTLACGAIMMAAVYGLLQLLK
jgi:Zn-dependent protease with chaperone function